MPFDLASLLDVSHLATFLGGAAVGSASLYLADRFTDQRREQKKASDEKKRFSKLNDVMPQLFQEMAKDLKEDQSATVREFVVLSNKNISFNSSKPRFMYFLSEHPNLKNQVSLLAEADYVQDVTVGNAPVFQMRDAFVLLLREL
jgi:hypothetical protein